jgi:hypothetical protein
LPDTEDHHKLGYTPDELQWAEENEEYIWRYFVEREVLYDTDSQLIPGFLSRSFFQVLPGAGQ